MSPYPSNRLCLNQVSSCSSRCRRGRGIWSIYLVHSSRHCSHIKPSSYTIWAYINLHLDLHNSHIYLLVTIWACISTCSYWNLYVLAGIAMKRLLRCSQSKKNLLILVSSSPLSLGGDLGANFGESQRKWVYLTMHTIWVSWTRMKKSWRHVQAQKWMPKLHRLRLLYLTYDTCMHTLNLSSGEDLASWA